MISLTQFFLNYKSKMSVNVGFSNSSSVVWTGKPFVAFSESNLGFHRFSCSLLFQAHMQARYVILRVLLEAGEKLVQLTSVTGSDGKPDVLISLDRTKIESVGRPAIGNFLRKLQVHHHSFDISRWFGTRYVFRQEMNLLTYSRFSLGVQINGRSWFRKDTVWSLFSSRRWIFSSPENGSCSKDSKENVRPSSHQSDR